MTQKRRVLIIDDDMTALDLIDFLFEQKGYEVNRSANGIDALGQVEENEPDVIIIDLMMPKMSGQECIAQLRAKGIVVPIVAFTALDDSHLHDEALQAGCNLVLTKPCKPSFLLEKIEALLASHSEAAEI